MTQAARGVVTGPAVPSRTGVTLLARLRAGSGQLVTRASLSSIAYAVSNVSTGASLGTGTFTISECVYDSLQQNDPRWTADSAASPGADGAHGLNFAATLPASLFALATLAAPSVLAGPARARTVQCDVVFTPVTGEPWRVTFVWQTLPTYG
jgi:hypothetical protein